MRNEETIWKGSPSQWVNFGFYLFWLLPMAWMGLGIVLSLWRYLTTKFTVIEITTERITEEKGVFSKTTDEVELYRVKDIRLEQPFFLRLVSLSNVLLVTTDRTHSIIRLGGVPDGKGLSEKLRASVEERRDTKGVREVDFA